MENCVKELERIMEIREKLGELEEYLLSLIKTGNRRDLIEFHEEYTSLLEELELQRQAIFQKIGKEMSKYKGNYKEVLEKVVKYRSIGIDPEKLLEDINDYTPEEFAEMVLESRELSLLGREYNLDEILGENWEYELARYLNRKQKEIRIVMTLSSPPDWENWKELPMERWYIEKRI